jgi:hypothetical protein
MENWEIICGVKYTNAWVLPLFWEISSTCSRPIHSRIPWPHYWTCCRSNGWKWTTLVEAILLNRAAIGIDVNPLSGLIAKVKTTPISIGSIEKTLDDFETFRSEHAKLDYSEYIPKDKYLDHWFSSETQEEIARTRWFIENNIVNQDVKDLFTVSLGASVRHFRPSNTIRVNVPGRPAYWPLPGFPGTHQPGCVQVVGTNHNGRPAGR